MNIALVYQNDDWFDEAQKLFVLPSSLQLYCVQFRLQCAWESNSVYSDTAIARSPLEIISVDEDAFHSNQNSSRLDPRGANSYLSGKFSERSYFPVRFLAYIQILAETFCDLQGREIPSLQRSRRDRIHLIVPRLIHSQSQGLQTCLDAKLYRRSFSIRDHREPRDILWNDVQSYRRSS